MEKYPYTLDKKMKLLSHICHFMSEHLVKASATDPVQVSATASRMPYLNQWFCTSFVVVMLLSNGTL